MYIYSEQSSEQFDATIETNGSEYFKATIVDAWDGSKQQKTFRGKDSKRRSIAFVSEIFNSENLEACENL